MGEPFVSLEEEDEGQGSWPEDETNNIVRKSSYPETQERSKQTNSREGQTYNQGSISVSKSKGSQQTYLEHDEYLGDISMEAVTIQMMPVRDCEKNEDSSENIGKDYHTKWESEDIEMVNEMHPIKYKVKTAVNTIAKLTARAPSKRKSLSDSDPFPKRMQNKTLPKQEKEEDEEKDDCPLCTEEGRLFSAGEGEMAKHFFEVHNIMDQGYECTECGAKAKERNLLVEHVNITHRQLKFCCDLCDYQTQYRNRIKSHKVSVHRVGGIPCASCLYVAPEIWVLTQHRRAIHKDFGDKVADVRYKCNYCDYQATQKSHLKCHMAALHQQLVFCCDMCDFQSKWKSRMMAHTRAKHMGIFLFCDHCEFKTVEKHSLKVHVKKKHGDIQFACFSCTDNFITRIELRKHMSDVHYMQTL